MTDLTTRRHSRAGTLTSPGGILASRDIYRSFAELTQQQRENQDWRRILERQSAAVALIAPHGGGIEAGTSEIATAIAGREFSLYCFEGIKVHGNRVLHISSHLFDDPMCLDLLRSTRIAITIHGCADSADVVYVGGLHKELRAAAFKSLSDAGFRAVDDCTNHDGNDPMNICNRCHGGKGVQLELSRGIRARMFAGLRVSERRSTTKDFESFVSVIRRELLAIGREQGFGSRG